MSYYMPKSNEDFTDLQVENKTPPEAEDDDCQFFKKDDTMLSASTSS